MTDEANITRDAVDVKLQMTGTAKPIKTKDLRKIDVPFGELSPEMQAALKEHGGPYEYRSLGSYWSQIFEPSWVEDFIYRVPPKSAKDPNRPRPLHKLGLARGDEVELVKWEDKYSGNVGMIFVVSADGQRVEHDNGIAYQIPRILRKGQRPLFRVISRAADRVSAESGAVTPFGVGHFNPKTGDVFSPIWTDAGKIWTVGKEYVWYGNLDGVQGSDGRLGCFCDRAKWRLVRRAPCPTCGQKRTP
jgi:hypothetical protein